MIAKNMFRPTIELFLPKQRNIFVRIRNQNIDKQAKILICNHFHTTNPNPADIFSNNINQRIEKYNHKANIFLCGNQLRNSSDLQPQKPAIKSNDIPSSNGQLSTKEIVKIFEHFMFRTIARTIDVCQIIWQSNELKLIQAALFDLMIGFKEMFIVHVLKNPKIESFIQNFQKKIDKARQYNQKQQQNKNE